VLARPLPGRRAPWIFACSPELRTPVTVPKFTCRAARHGSHRRAVFFCECFFSPAAQVRPGVGAAPSRPPRTLNFCMQPRIMMTRCFIYSICAILVLMLVFCMFFLFACDKSLMLNGQKFKRVFQFFSCIPISFPLAIENLFKSWNLFHEISLQCRENRGKEAEDVLRNVQHKV
jgi:hypothetical protein